MSAPWITARRALPALLIVVGAVVGVGLWAPREEPAGPPTRPAEVPAAEVADGGTLRPPPLPDPPDPFLFPPITSRGPVERFDGTIAGRVEYAEGQPVEGGWLYLSPLSAEHRHHGRARRTTRVGADGTFRETGLAPGPYTIRLVRKVGGVEERQGPWEVEAGTVDAVLQVAGADAEILVLGPDGAPVAGARVVTTGPRGPGGGMTDKDGTVRLRGLDPDATCSMRIDPPKNRQDLAPVSVEEFVLRNTTVTL
ncbi:MAG: carboxypeptidase-like regulatory domain-containing protein, partial [Planctomycetota bacterium]